jgi:excisionase family DNA binding protein
MSTSTPEQLAERWGCSARIVKDLIRNGELPAFYIGTVPRVRAEDVAAFEEKGESLALPQNRRPVSVYVVRCESFIKIGKAMDTDFRLSYLQAANPFDLEVIAILKGDGNKLERELHKRFAAHRHRGEWFRLSPELHKWISAGCPVYEVLSGSPNLPDCTKPEHLAQEGTTP